MILKDFIGKLKRIEKKEGGDLEVTMADSIPVVDPVFLNKYDGKSVVITDQDEN